MQTFLKELVNFRTIEGIWACGFYHFEQAISHFYASLELFLLKIVFNDCLPFLLFPHLSFYNSGNECIFRMFDTKLKVITPNMFLV